MQKRFMLVECFGGIAPSSLPRFDTLEEAEATAERECRNNPDYDLVFVVELTETGADVVYVMPNEIEESE